MSDEPELYTTAAKLFGTEEQATSACVRALPLSYSPGGEAGFEPATSRLACDETAIYTISPFLMQLTTLRNSHEGYYSVWVPHLKYWGVTLVKAVPSGLCRSGAP